MNDPVYEAEDLRFPEDTAVSEGAKITDITRYEEENFHELIRKDATVSLEETGNEARPLNKRPSGGDAFKILSRIIGSFFCAVSLIFYCAAASFFIKDTSVEKLLKAPISEVFGEIWAFVEYEPTNTDEVIDTSHSGGDTEKEDDQTAPDFESFPIEKADLSVSEKSLFSLNNQTRFSVKPNELIKSWNALPCIEEIYEEYKKSAPAVLIMHTHGTEAYSENNESYITDSPFRSNDKNKNVVSVGEVMAEVFRSAGINVIHDTEMYDAESYRDSYNRSRAAALKHLEDNPSITYIFDVHRDAVIREDKTAVAPLFTYNEEDTAQAMLVVGTDQDGAEHKNWKENLTLALLIQKELCGISEDLPRNINLRTSAFNQGVSRGSLLLEIGSCGNTLIQAKRCAVLCAVSITKVISGREHPVSISKLMEKFVSE